MKVSPLQGLGQGAVAYRKLKHTVNNVPSLRDWQSRLCRDSTANVRMQGKVPQGQHFINRGFLTCGQRMNEQKQSIINANQ
ncbi:MAG: hypothetical protein LBL42_04760 [Tannerella sp.]|nr:hypothetical protein [Tannerella sp.]